MQGKSLGKGGVAPVLLRPLSPSTLPLGSPVSKVGEYCCLTKLAFSWHGFPQELSVSRAWVHDNTCNNRGGSPMPTQNSIKVYESPILMDFKTYFCTISLNIYGFIMISDWISQKGVRESQAVGDSSNNCVVYRVVPRSCRLCKHGTRMPVKGNNAWGCVEPCEFTHGIVKL